MKLGGMVFLIFMLILSLVLYKMHYPLLSMVIFLIFLASAFSSGKLG